MLGKCHQMKEGRSWEDHKLGKGEMGREEEALWWSLFCGLVALQALAYALRKSRRSLNSIGSLPEIFI